MMKILKNYSQMIVIFVAIIIGGIIGIYFKDWIPTLKPFGDLFINLIFTVTVPLVFFTISSSIANMKQPKRLGKVMTAMVIVITITSIIAILVGILSTYIVKPLTESDIEKIRTSEFAQNTQMENTEVNLLEQIISTLTVKEFSDLLSTQNMIALIVFSAIFGFATNFAKEKGKAIADFLISGNEVMMKVISIIMYYAPIGLGCYFATVIAQLGSSLISGYLRCFIIYTVIAILYYFIIYTLYAFISGGKKGIKVFWKNVLPTTVTALATCSSAATIPFGIKAARKMGMSNDIAETIVPLGVNIHKDGSLIGAVMKLAFLVAIFGGDIGIASIIGGSLIVGLLMGSVPGAGLVSEMMILTIFGFPAEALGIIAIIGTIIECPGAVLNGVGNLSCSMLVSRFVDGRNWIKEETQLDEKETRQ